MEDMVPELQSYVSQGYFSKEETRTIANARRDHEYRLKRKAPLLPDFLRYIEYERAVAELVRSRRRAMAPADRPKKSIADRAGDRRVHFIFTRACRKFRGDLSLWSAWLEFCAASGSRRRGGKVAASALALHSREPALWAAAAAWEYSGGGGIGGGSEEGGSRRKKTRAKEGGSNPAAARALMQRGLRACGASSDLLWAEYLRLELAYAATLRARREVLGVGGGAGKKKKSDDGESDVDESDDDESESESEADDEELAILDGDDDDESVPPPPKKQKKTAAKAAKAAAPPPPAAVVETDAATKAVLDGQVAAVVARSAVVADRGNLERRLRLLSTLQDAGRKKTADASSSELVLALLPGARRAAAELYEGLAKDFPNEPRARAVLARGAVAEAELLHSSKPSSAAASASASALGESLAAFDAAVAELPVEGMFDEFVSFLKERLAKAEEEREAGEAPPATPPPSQPKKRGQKQQQPSPAAPASSTTTTIELLNKRLERVCAAAAAAGVASEATLLEWPQAALRRRRVRAALEAAERATDPASSSSSASASASSAAVWRARLALMGTLAAASSESNDKLWAQLARATREGASAVAAAEAKKSSAGSVGAAAAAAPLWKESFAAVAKAAAAASTSSGGSSSSKAALEQAFEELTRGLASSILASPCSPDPRGGLGAAAAAALVAAQALSEGGGEGSSSPSSPAVLRRRALADLLLSPGRPSPGGDFFDLLLEMEIEEALALQQQQQEVEAEEGSNDRRRKASAAASAAAVVERFVEAALAAPTARDDARPWLHYLRWEQERKPAGQGVGRVHWRAGKALRGGAAHEFALAVSSR